MENSKITKDDIQKQLTYIQRCGMFQKHIFSREFTGKFYHKQFGAKSYKWTAIYYNEINLLDSMVESGDFDDFEHYALMPLILFDKKDIVRFLTDIDRHAEALYLIDKLKNIAQKKQTDI